MTAWESCKRRSGGERLKVGSLDLKRCIRRDGDYGALLSWNPEERARSGIGGCE